MPDPKTLTSPGDLTIDPTGTDPGTAPCLTIACHPDMRRAGEQATPAGLLGGERVALSRLHPEGGRPQRRRDRPGAGDLWRKYQADGVELLEVPERTLRERVADLH